MKSKIATALISFPDDYLLKNTFYELQTKTEKSFKKKENLINFDSSICNHIKDLSIEKDFFGQNDNIDEESEDEGDDLDITN